MMLWLISATRGPSAAKLSIALTQILNFFVAVAPSNLSTIAFVNVMPSLTPALRRRRPNGRSYWPLLRIW